MFLLNFHWGSQIFNLETLKEHYQGKILLKQSLEILFFHPNLHTHVCITNVCEEWSFFIINVKG